MEYEYNGNTYYAEELSDSETIASIFSTSVPNGQKKAEKSRKKTAISPPQFFKSNINGKRIVYGNTGIATPHIVGSADEDLYFKVKIATGLIPYEPVTLFYDNPREYCVHYLTSICKSREKFKEEEPEVFAMRVENMLQSMDTLIKKWEEKRNNYVSERLQEDAIRRKLSQNFVEIR